MKLNVHQTYVCFSEAGCTISLRDGTPCKEVPAHEPTLFVAQQSDMVCSDPAAVVRKIPNGLQLLHGQMMKEQAAGGLPAGFKRVEYLDCEKDKIQYIETPVYVDRDCEVSAVFLNEYNTTICRTSQLNGAGLLTQTQTWDAGHFGSWWGETNPYNKIEVIGQLKLGEKSEIKNSAKGLSYDGVFYPRANPSSASALTKMTFFTSAFPLGYKGARIYECSIAKNGKHLFRGLPCLDSTGTPCMYDTVSKQPFYNLGEGDFIYPTGSTTYALRRVLPDWGKLTEHGLRRLYHAPANYQGELVDYALENGYKQIVEPEKPEEGYWSPRWTETEDEIVLEWVEAEPPLEDLTNN